MIMIRHHRLRSAAALCVSTALAGCMVGPNYHRPSAPVSATFKEARGWTTATPADALDKGDWWMLFDDPVLNGLEARVRVSNQNVAAAAAAYREARAIVAEDRASLFPTVNLNGGATHAGSGRRTGGATIDPTTGQVLGSSSSSSSTTYRVSLGASWEPDLWGRIRRTIQSARANAEASSADLANATLSAQGELASDYFALRTADTQIAVNQASVEAYRRLLQIIQNQYNAGTAPHSDVLQQQSQLDNALADLQAVSQQRADYEHAIAVLLGEPPGDFSLPTDPNWKAGTPQPPPGVPSTLLERRPDIAAAERRMAAANAQIGVQVAAYYPNLNLTGSYGFTSTELGRLFDASNAVWSIGGTAAETLLDFGARHARVQQARAAYDQTVAQYRQTVLTALGDVENQLVANRVLAREYALRQDAATAANTAEQMVVNQYRAGIVSYVNVVTAQTAAYNARNALAQAAGQRQEAAVSLIQALGGGWRQP